MTTPGAGTPGYIPIDDIPSGISAETLMQTRLHHAGGVSDSVMFVVEEGGGTFSGSPMVWLNAGVSPAHGMLQWVDRTGYYVPSERHNTNREGWIHFRHPTGVTVPLSAAMRAPLALVYEAIDEVIATKSRPTCVEWVLSKHRKL